MQKMIEKKQGVQKLLEEKKEEMLGLLQLTEKIQAELKASEENEENEGQELSRLLEERQVKMDRIDGLDQEFLLAFRELKEQLGIKDLSEATGSDHSELVRLKNMVSEIMEIVNKLNELESENTVQLKQQVDVIKHQINTVRQGKRSMKAYENVPTATDGYFYDKKK